VDLNLNTLKREILDHLEVAGCAVFHSTPGGLEGQSLVLWDTEKHPDYQMFLDVARKAGINLILFASAEFQSDEIDDLMEHLEACELSREEYRDYESRLREMRIFEGVTCSLELAFDYHSRFYVFELRPEWYDDFLNIEDEINSHLADAADQDDSDSLGGYFSRN
jgi:hypothetical protein